ncbi:MAG: ribosome-associated translation inhibitor RaiA [Myxococcales bacterium]|nr:ribosome-associated translation inhibitor RaiA [Myxococcales bacterium]
MPIPLQVTFRDMDASDFVRNACEEQVAKLERLEPRVQSCHVTVAAPHQHHHKGRLFSVHLDITVPGHPNIVVSRDPHDDHGHEDAYVTLRDAFKAANQQLTKLSAKRRTRRTPDVPQV